MKLPPSRNRVLAAALSALLLVAGAALAGWTADARAQLQRMLPAEGEVGVLRGDADLPLPLVRIDSKVFRLAPGGIIVDQNNRTLLHGQLPARAAAYVVFDRNGDILRMFLLTPQELQRLRQR